MSDVKKYIEAIFSKKGVEITKTESPLFDSFIEKESVKTVIDQIKNLQDSLMANWELEARLDNVNRQQIMLPNAKQGKSYEAAFDIKKYNWEFSHYELKGLEEVGLLYNPETKLVSGIPNQSGDLKVVLLYRLSIESEDTPLHEKPFTLVVNPDPKSLWKDIPSDQTASFAKADSEASFGELGDKKIVAASKRGRSHANVGSFRDDHFAYKHFENTGWNVVSVSDGAGSAKVSRKGSELACDLVLEWFEQNLTPELDAEFERLARAHKTNSTENTPIELSQFLRTHFFNTPQYVHDKMAEFAAKEGYELKDLHATLIYAAFKKFDFGYVIFTFGVGDCPIGLLDADKSSIKLMNWLDVGEFGGGTRFITMPEVLTSDKFKTRFSVKMVDDFSYLFLMTDGIYDPKFEVEANLEKLDKWLVFVDDLQGKNEDGSAVEFNPENTQIASQLSTWMDFWSPGNHDDRTLAVIF